MDDLYFEKKLREEIRRYIEKELEKKITDVDMKSYKINKIDKIYEGYIYNYLHKKYSTNNGDIDYDNMYKEYDEIFQQFEKQFSGEELNKLCKNFNFSPEIKAYLKLLSLQYYDVKSSIAELIFRKLMVEKYGKEVLENLKDVLKNYWHLKEGEELTHYTELFSENLYSKNYSEELKNKIEEDTNFRFNQLINCGGYAFKIDAAVFPIGNDFGQSVSRILEHFPFVRLLGDKPLQEDEYLVFYRLGKGGRTSFY